VPKDSTHNSYDDVLLFFGDMYAPVLKLVSSCHPQQLQQAALPRCHLLTVNVPSATASVQAGCEAKLAPQLTSYLAYPDCPALRAAQVPCQAGSS
jgi:hypothetical protein